MTDGQHDSQKPNNTGENGQHDSQWLNDLPDDIKTASSIQNFKTVGDLAKGFINLKSMQGDSIRIPSSSAGDEAHAEFREKLMKRVPDLVKIPDDDAGDEAWQAFEKAIGRPEDKDKYALPEELKDRTDLQELAFNQGLTARQFKQFIKKVQADEKDATTLREQAQRDRDADLYSKWGAALEDRTKDITAALTRLGAPDAIMESVTNNTAPVEVMEFLHRVTNSLGGEGGEMGNQPSGGNAAKTPAQLQAEKAEIMDNAAYWDDMSPKNKVLRARMAEIQKQLAGG